MKRCTTLGGHYMLLLFFGYCPCGYDGCPKSEAEFKERKTA